MNIIPLHFTAHISVTKISQLLQIKFSKLRQAYSCIHVLCVACYFVEAQNVLPQNGVWFHMLHTCVYCACIDWCSLASSPGLEEHCYYSSSRPENLTVLYLAWWLAVVIIIRRHDRTDHPSTMTLASINQCQLEPGISHDKSIHEIEIVETVQASIMTT